MPKSGGSNRGDVHKGRYTEAYDPAVELRRKYTFIGGSGEHSVHQTDYSR